MKRNSIKIITFLILIFLIDFSIGLVSDKFITNMMTGSIGIVNKTVQDTSQVLILGSSRAQNHYNSKLISEISNTSVYNAGVGGYGVFYNYAVLSERIKNDKPELVILDIAPNILIDRKQYDKLNVYQPIMKKYQAFDSIVRLNPNFKQFLIMSNAYRYNSTLFDIVYEVSSTRKSLDNFVSLEGVIQEDIFKKNGNALVTELSQDEEELLYVQIDYIYKIKQLCEKSSIEFKVFLSPSFYEDQKINKTRNLILMSLKQLDINYYDFYTDSSFYKKNALFKDVLHLNNKGNELYSKEVATIVKREINIRN